MNWFAWQNWVYYQKATSNSLLFIFIKIIEDGLIQTVKTTCFSLLGQRAWDRRGSTFIKWAQVGWIFTESKYKHYQYALISM